MVLILAMLVFPLLLGQKNRLGDLVCHVLYCCGACGDSIAVIANYLAQRQLRDLTQFTWRIAWIVAILHCVVLLGNRL